MALRENAAGLDSLPDVSRSSRSTELTKRAAGNS
jgi:hypothetical protein